VAANLVQLLDGRPAAGGGFDLFLLDHDGRIEAAPVPPPCDRPGFPRSSLRKLSRDIFSNRHFDGIFLWCTPPTWHPVPCD